MQIPKKYVFALTLTSSLILQAVASELKSGGDDRTISLASFSSSYRSPALPKDKQIPELCKKFINDDGTYGEYGEFLKKELTGQGKSSLRASLIFETNPTDIHKTCKRYDSFGPDERLNFWIWTIAAMAKDESGCDSSNDNKAAGPNRNNIAVGLTQTPKIENGLAPKWRGPGCGTPPSYHDAKQQLSCTVQIIAGHLEGNYRKGPDSKRDGYTPFDNTSYWATLRPNNTENKKTRDAGTDTLSIIKGFPACQNPK